MGWVSLSGGRGIHTAGPVLCKFSIYYIPFSPSLPPALSLPHLFSLQSKPKSALSAVCVNCNQNKNKWPSELAFDKINLAKPSGWAREALWIGIFSKAVSYNSCNEFCSVVFLISWEWVVFLSVTHALDENNPHKNNVVKATRGYICKEQTRMIFPSPFICQRVFVYDRL